jgi:hypothetical protein
LACVLSTVAAVIAAVVHDLTRFALWRNRNVATLAVVEPELGEVPGGGCGVRAAAAALSRLLAQRAGRDATPVRR